MSTLGIVMFVARSLAGEFEGREGLRVIDVGSYSTFDGFRPLVDLHGGFSEYVGVDLKEGPGIDVVCEAERLIERFGEESFDLVIATELIEHVKDWRLVVSNLKRICTPGGIIIVTTRSHGYVFHPVPCDFWRFETDDMRRIFSDCSIRKLEDDYEFPGVWVKVRKPDDFAEVDLSDCMLYSIVADRRVKDVVDPSANRSRFLVLVAGSKLREFALWLSVYPKDDPIATVRRQVKNLVELLKAGLGLKSF